MQTKILLAILALFPITAKALTGRTADGCTYKVINGQYFTNCDAKKSAEKSATVPASELNNGDIKAEATATAPSSYGEVPMRGNGAPTHTIAVPAPKTYSSVEPEQEKAPVIREDYTTERKRKVDTLQDSAYVGVHMGSFSQGDAGSSTGFGINLGTPVDSHYGFELGYGYTSTGIQLGNAGSGTTTNYSSRSDASLKSHLFTGELHAYLTDTLARFRPYVGAGLGYKSSTLKEKQSADEFGITRMGSLSQTSIGLLGSGGLRFRVADTFQIAAGIKYFLPVSRSDARLETGRGEYGNTPTKLSAADDTFTGSGMFQILGGIQYHF